MSWAQRTSQIVVGDTVAYGKPFLRSIAAYSGDLPHARGRVTRLVALSPDVVLAEIAWDRPDVPDRVNVKNLCRVRDIPHER